MKSKEEWKQSITMPNYEVSNLGRIRSLYRKNYHNIIKYFVNHKGYALVSLFHENRRCTKRLHRLIAEVFINNDNGLSDVNHKDGNKLNNHKNNLEWCTKKQNIQHYFKGLKLGKRNEKILVDFNNGCSKKELAKKYKLTIDSIRKILVKGSDIK